jgi:hypothetical protein
VISVRGVEVVEDRLDRGWPKEKGFPPREKVTAATSAPHIVGSSLSMLKSPTWRFEKQTCRPTSLSMSLISIFLCPLLMLIAHRDAIAAYP